MFAQTLSVTYCRRQHSSELLRSFIDEVYVLIVDGYLLVIIGDYLLCLDIHLMKYLNRIETLGDMIHMTQNKTLSCGFPNEVLSIE